MTIQQSNAIWEMWRQGLHRLAAHAERHWSNGEAVVLDSSVRVPRMLRHLVDQCNRQSAREDYRQATNRQEG